MIKELIKVLIKTVISALGTYKLLEILDRLIESIAEKRDEDK